MPRKSFYISLVLLAGVYALLHLLERGPVVVAARNLGRLTAHIAGYDGTDFAFEDRVMEELDPDDTLSRRYVPGTGDLQPIVLYVGYYGTAKGGRTGHNPYACYPGAGWGVVSDERVPVDFAGRTVSVNEIVVKRGLETQVVLFWYQSQRDRIIARGLQQNLNRFCNRLLHGRDDGAFVRLSADAPEQVAPVSNQLRRFASQLMPLLAANWPAEREVSGEGPARPAPGR